jgi:hypothetical protein
MPSQAYTDFLDSLKLAEALLSLESRYTDPPIPRSQKTVEALRGGATVLMVAAFENYLRELVEEHLVDMTVTPLQFQMQKVPEHTRRINIEKRLEYIRNQKADTRVTEYLTAAQLISSGVIMSDSFTAVAQNNPNSKKVRELYFCFGIEDFFREVKANFDHVWGVPTATTFIADKLDEIVNSRHIVAHRAKVLNISRLELQEWLRFLKTLGLVCDQTLFAKIRTFF